MPHGLYTHLPLVCALWEGINMNLVLGLLRTQRDFDSIFLVVDRFSKMTHFIPFYKVDDANNISKLFLRQIEAVNRSISTILRLIMKGNSKYQDEYLPHINAYNIVVHMTTNIFSFEVVYGFNPHTPLDLLHFPNPHEFVYKEGVTKAEFIKKLHERIRTQMQEKN